MLALAGAAVGAALAGPAPGTFRYCNTRFGFCVTLPTDLVASPEPANGDGREFRQPRGLVLTVSGINNVLSTSLEREQQERSRDFDTIDHHARGRDWFLLSGSRGSEALLLKAYIGEGSIQGLRIRLPLAEAERRRPQLQAIAASFRPGDLSASH